MTDGIAPQNPLDDVVSRQYEQWMYPAPIFDIPAWLEHNWQWFDPSHAHALFWPDKEERESLDILVAGCGTNQAAVIAFTNPQARVVAIDVSDASLSHHRRISETYGLRNLELHRLPIEDVASLGRDFDLIISTGVLHHLADPQIGMNALASCLRTEGVLAVMLYATYGRLGVHMLQSVFQDLGLQQDEASVGIVREVIATLDPSHPLHSYLNIARDLDDDAGLVDTFLHGRERTYTVAECQDMVAAAGLVFQDLFLKAPYYAPRGTGNPFFGMVAALPDSQQWSIMERINSRNACHYFLACRTERSRESYVIDFADTRVMDAVPSFRKACRFEGNVLYRWDWELPLDTFASALMSRVDGHASIDEIVAQVIETGAFTGRDADNLRHTAHEVFRQLWQRDFIAMSIRR
jgi:SAM-dependent methyltransferase